MLVEAEIPAAYVEGMRLLAGTSWPPSSLLPCHDSQISTYYHMPIILQQNLHTYYSVHYHL